MEIFLTKIYLYRKYTNKIYNLNKIEIENYKNYVYLC